MVTDSRFWKVLLRIVLVVAFLVSLVFPSYAQCLKKGGPPAGRLTKTTGNSLLDAKFNAEGNLLYRVFEVNPNMFVLDDFESPNAYAAPLQTLPGYTGTVYFGVRLLANELWTMDKGEHAVAGIMAHEFAHILQLKRRSRLQGKYRELHADFMAGYYLGKKSYISPTNIGPFARSLYEKGDYAFWSRSHGMPAERVMSMMAGLGHRRLSLRAAYKAGEDCVRDLNACAEEIE